MAQIPNSHLSVNVNDVTVFVDSRNIYTSDHPSLFGVGVPHPGDCLLCFSTVSPLLTKKTPEIAPPHFAFLEVLFQSHGGSRDGRSPGELLLFLVSWLPILGNRRQEARGKGMAIIKAERSGRMVFFWVRLALIRTWVRRIAWLFFFLSYFEPYVRKPSAPDANSLALY